MENLKPIPGLNITKGIELHNNSKENFLKVLRSFFVSTKSKLPLLEDIDNIKQYEITTHGIKGSGRGICADDIGNKAAELEKAAIGGDIDFINKNNPAFIQELKALLDDLENMFNELDSKIVKQKKDKPDKEALARLLAACDIYDMVEVESAIKSLCKYQYENDNDLVEWLKRSAEGMQYDQIVERLSISK